jgi:hypothetical protein
MRSLTLIRWLGNSRRYYRNDSLDIQHPRLRAGTCWPMRRDAVSTLACLPVPVRSVSLPVNDDHLLTAHVETRSTCPAPTPCAPHTPVKLQLHPLRIHLDVARHELLTSFACDSPINGSTTRQPPTPRQRRNEPSFARYLCQVPRQFSSRTAAACPFPRCSLIPEYAGCRACTAARDVLELRLSFGMPFPPTVIALTGSPQWTTLHGYLEAGTTERSAIFKYRCVRPHSHSSWSF